MAKSKNPAALITQAHRKVKQGDFAGARKLYRLIARRGIKNARLLQEAGGIAYQCNDFQQAIDYWRQASVLAPKVATLFSQMGVAWRKLKRFEEAKQQHLKALALDPDQAMIHNNLGNTLRDLGENDQAAHHFAEAIRLAPNYPQAHGNLGNVFLDREDYEGAEKCYRQALKLDQNYLSAWVDLGCICRLQDKFDDAIKCFRKALAVDPRHAPAYLNLANTLRRTGRLDGTEEMHSKALELDPSLAEAWVAVAGDIQAAGDDDEAVHHLRRAMDLDPDLTSPYLTLASIQHVGLTQDEIERAEQKLSASVTKTVDRSILHFALARAYEAAKDYDSAFRHAAAANKIDHVHVDFDADANRAFIDRSIELYDRTFFEARQDFGVDSDRPILVLGLPRSGTTLVEQIIASHPDVYGAGELIDFPDAQARVAKLLEIKKPFPDIVTDMTAPVAKQVAGEYLRLLKTRDETTPHITDKLPFNFRHLGLFHLLFPNAKIIHCRRDPRDVAISCYFLKFTKPISFAYDLDDFAAYYEQYIRLMDHWRSIFPNAIYDIRYEELVEEKEKKTREMIDFLGLPWDDICLDHRQAKREIKTASSWQVRQPVYKTSVDRWRRYEKHIEPILHLQ